MSGFSFEKELAALNSDAQGKASVDQRPFVKMHGLGNDFVIFDARMDDFELDALLVKALGNRRTGIGFDQCVVLRASQQADVFMEIWNSDGSRVGACGNASRCVGYGIMGETGSDTCTIQTDAGILAAASKGDQVLVDMGPVETGWAHIPLFQAANTKSVDLGIKGVPPGVCVNVGNPHIVFFFDQVMTVPVAELGPEIERHWMFPEKVNVSFVEMRPDHLRVRVWERGVGITRACGTAACASLVAGSLRELCGRSAKVALDGGVLSIKWLDNSHVLMTGSVAHAFTGVAPLTVDEGL